MTDQLVGKMKEQAPWRKGVGWPVVAAEGALLAGLGLFVLLDKDTARDVIFQIIGTVLLVSSALVIWKSFRTPQDPMVPYAMLRGGVGATVGVLAVMRWWSDYLDNYATRMILGWGLIVFTLLHLVGIVMVRGRDGLNLASLVMSGLTIVLGIILLTGSDDASSGSLTLLGTILLVFGLLLLAFAYYIFQKKDTTGGDTAPPENATVADPPVQQVPAP